MGLTHVPLALNLLYNLVEISKISALETEIYLV